jgi:nodulation protein E
MRRVVVTGLGVISALGANAGEFWAALCEGRSGIRPIQRVDRSLLRYPNGAEVLCYDERAHFEARQADFIDRFAQFAIVAAREAVRDAGVRWDDGLAERTAIIVGTGVGGQDTQEMMVERLLKDGRVSPAAIPRIMGNAGASHISSEFGITGPTYAVNASCASSNCAIGQAFWMVRSGAVDAAITGGSEAPFSLGHLRAWEAMRALSPDTCRPFSRNRDGTVLGEGAAMLVLESYDRARARGATIYGEIAGLGMAADAGHITQPAVHGMARAMRLALQDARVLPEQVAYINAHGSGTRSNDSTEATAIRAVFGQHVQRLPVSGTKSLHGHAIGASSALEAVATILAVRHGILPPTANFTEADPECDLDVVRNEARRAPAEVAVSNSFGFGGLNAVLVFRRA